MIQYIFGIRSMRQTLKEIEVNFAYRWYIGYNMHEQLPHFSTFSKNYARRFKDTDLFEKIFAGSLATEFNEANEPEASLPCIGLAPGANGSLCHHRFRI